MNVLHLSNLRFAWQAWHFVTCGRVWQRVDNRFSWQAQYFCDVFRRCITFFVAGAALWTCPTQFFVAGAVLQTCRVPYFSQIAMARLREVAVTCKFRGRRGIFLHVSKLEEVSHEMLVLRFARVSWRVSGCAVTMGEAAMPYV